jgi:hypothetical protein
MKLRLSHAEHIQRPLVRPRSTGGSRGQLKSKVQPRTRERTYTVLVFKRRGKRSPFTQFLRDVWFDVSSLRLNVSLVLRSWLYSSGRKYDISVAIVCIAPANLYITIKSLPVSILSCLFSTIALFTEFRVKIQPSVYADRAIH